MITMRHAIPGVLSSVVPVVLVVAFVGCGLFSSGCTLPPERVDGVVEGVTQDDIPKPPRFTVRDSWMYSHPETDTGFFRSCKTEFVGRGKLKELTSWYLDEMSQLGWRRRDVDIGSTRIMTFSKKAEYAKVSMFREYNVKDKVFETVITVEIGPQKTENAPIYQVIPAPGSGRTPAQSFGDMPIRPKSEIGKFEPVKPYETEISSLREPRSDELQTRRASLELFNPEVLPASSTGNSGSSATVSYESSATSGTGQTGPAAKGSVSGASNGGLLLDEAIHGPPLPDVLDDISDGTE